MTTAAVVTSTPFRDLRVWQESVELVKDVYPLCSKLPKDELYGLASQMKRAIVSVASNIAEGHARHHRAESRHSLYIAVGSLAEIETQLHIACELSMIMKCDAAPLVARINHLRAMLLTLTGRLR